MADNYLHTPALIITSTIVITSTLGATKTITKPAATAACTETVIPKPVKTTITKAVTWSRTIRKQTFSVVYETKTAKCTIPPRAPRPDPLIHYHPKRFHPEVLEDKNYLRRARFQRRDLDKRAPDAPTITITASPPVNTTTTITGPTVTDTLSTSVITTSYTNLPDSTVKSGTYTVTTTLPTPTYTKVDIEFKKTTTVVTHTRT
jgi:hypothetical protein